MEMADFDEIIELSAKHIKDQMSVNGWLGEILESNHFSVAEITTEELHTILVKTVLKLYETWEDDSEPDEISYDECDDDDNWDLDYESI